MKSIVQDEQDRCFVCGCSNDLEWHHVFYGHRYRDKSERFGLMVRLCHFHHQDHKCGVHHNIHLDRRIKRLFQMEFSERYGDIKWHEEFDINYL